MTVSDVTPALTFAVRAVYTGKQLGKQVDWMDAAGQERALWEQMIERPGYWVEGSVPLRFSMERAVTADK